MGRLLCTFLAYTSDFAFALLLFYVDRHPLLPILPLYLLYLTLPYYYFTLLGIHCYVYGFVGYVNYWPYS